MTNQICEKCNSNDTIEEDFPYIREDVCVTLRQRGYSGKIGRCLNCGDYWEA